LLADTTPMEVNAASDLTPASSAGRSRVRPKSTRSPRTCSTRWPRCPARTAW
jgi:hypothetical protein